MAEVEEKVPEQIMDLETLEMVDNPEFKKDEGGEEGETDDEKAARLDQEEEEEEVETEEEKAARIAEEEEAKAKLEDETEEEKTARLEKEAEEGEGETEEEKAARIKKEEEDKGGEEPTFDSLIADNLAEKYEINTEDELFEILDHTELVLNNNEQLKKDLEDAKKQDPVFKSGKDKKAFEFLKDYKVDKFGNGLGNYARLIGMEPESMNDKIALQESYVLRNPELDREDAIELFNDEYEQYSVSRDDFEEEGDYDKKQKLKDIKKKKDVSAARNYLLEQQEKFMSSDDEDENADEGKEEDKAKAEVRAKAVAKYSKLVDDSLDGFDSLIFQFGDKKDSDFTFKLNKDQLNKVELSMKNYLKDSAIYNDKGEIADFDADDTKVRVTMAMFGYEMFDEVYKQGVTDGETKKVESIGKKKPDRKSVRGGGDGDITVEDQFEQLAAAMKKKRQTSQHFID